MTVPRENRLVRFYIHLRGEMKEEAMQHPSRAPRAMVEMAEGLMKPYSLTYNHCDWWSIYPVRLHVHLQVLVANDEIKDRPTPSQAIQTT
jgi:phenol 2-monooxygenase